MPHLVLEYSANIVEGENLFELFKKCHVLLMEILPTDIESCKSRAIKYNEYYIGNGDLNNAFVHVDIKIMPGRDLIKLKNVSCQILDILKEYFIFSAKELNLQITVEVTELEETYLKFISKIK